MVRTSYWQGQAAAVAPAGDARISMPIGRATKPNVLTPSMKLGGAYNFPS